MSPSATWCGRCASRSRCAVATALFANSPFTEGRPNGFTIYHALRDLARHRPGPHRHDPVRVRGRVRLRAVRRLGARRPDVFHQARLDLSRRRGLVLPRPSRRPASGAAARSRPVRLGEPRLDPVPEVRLKRYLEMRGADAGPPERIVALSAFWVGLLYDAAALDQAWQLVKGWSAEEREALRADVPARARRRRRRPARCARSPATRCESLMRASRPARGATRRAPTRPAISPPSTRSPPAAPAELLLERYEGSWGRSVEPAFRECVF